MARRTRKNKKEEESSGGGNWMTTFSDLMTLLLTFFVLLFSMSEISEEKFASASMSIQTALIGNKANDSILDGAGFNEEDGVGEEEGDGLDDEVSSIPQEVQEMYEEALRIIEEEGITEEISVASDQDGVYLDIQESILFGSGDANVSRKGRETLDSLVSLLELAQNDIIVEGFTDNVPMNSEKYPSNWELSTGRAMAVVRHLVADGIEPSRLSGRGYGEYNPVVPNNNSENRAKNRRVNIVLVYKPEEEVR